MDGSFHDSCMYMVTFMIYIIMSGSFYDSHMSHDFYYKQELVIFEVHNCITDDSQLVTVSWSALYLLLAMTAVSKLHVRCLHK